MDTNQKYIAIAAAILILLLFGNADYSQKEALVTSGYNVNPDCTFATNVNPQTSRAIDYRNADAWITMDKDGDGVWEKYGQKSFGTIFITYPEFVTDYNSYDDDIRSPSATYDILYIGSVSDWTTFERDYGAAASATIPSCASSSNLPPSDGVCDGDACWSFNDVLTVANNWVQRDKSVCQ